MSALVLPDLAQAIEREHQAAHCAARSALEHALECGRLLLSAKSRVDHGEWLGWVEANVSFGDRQARKYMRLWQHRDQIGTADSDFSIAGCLEALAEPNTAHSLRVMGSSASDEWYTPAHIAERTAAALGGAIDLDPCWTAASLVRAATTYTIDDDGLARRWQGRTYLNPPYSEVDDWVAKLVEEHEAGAVSEAVVLVPARVDTRWFRRLDDYPRCFVYGRLQFSNSGVSAPFPTAIFYLGPNVARFAAVFSEVGGTWVRFNGGAS